MREAVPASTAIDMVGSVSPKSRRASLPTLKNTAFAQAPAAGTTTVAAYVEAGYKTSPSTAAKMNANESIRQRIRDLQDAAAERAEMMAAQVLEDIGHPRALRSGRQPPARGGHARQDRQGHLVDQGHLESRSRLRRRRNGVHDRDQVLGQDRHPGSPVLPFRPS